MYQEVSLKDLLKDVSNTPVLIKRPEKLKNKYFGLRHGESMANIANIISSGMYIRIHVYVFTCVYVCVYVCLFVCMFICIYIFIYSYTHSCIHT
jgi:hypothetical protein